MKPHKVIIHLAQGVRILVLPDNSVPDDVNVYTTCDTPDTGNSSRLVLISSRMWISHPQNIKIFLEGKATCRLQRNVTEEVL
jgi:hypothetical protein